MTQFDIITLFPEALEPYCASSILRRAQEKKLLKIQFCQLRKFGIGKRRTVDGAPYGGGAGMVLMAGPIVKAVEALKKTKPKTKKTKVILLSAKGKQFDQHMAYRLAKQYKKLILISGRYEGVDERVKRICGAQELSVGPYVLTGGELPALLLVDAVARLIPGVINEASLKEESFSSLLEKKSYKLIGKGEYPHYTRPEVFLYKGKKYPVPKLLLSGNHAAIARWRETHRVSL
jgi:tRNA (guanine37-N1)-methyltransferase